MIWQGAPLTIDGKADEWGNPLRYYDKNSKLFYEIKNDRKNIYIAFKANENDIIMRAKQRGIKIAMDTAKGKDDYPTSITFPFRKRPIMPMGKPDMDGKNRGKQWPDSLAHQKHIPQRSDSTFSPKDIFIASSIKLIGFSGKDTDIIPAKENTYGIEAAMPNDPKTFFFELKIPFAEIYKRDITASDTTKAIYFEITLETSQIGDIRMPRQGGPGNMENGGGPSGAPMGMGSDMPSGPPPMDGNFGGGGPGGHGGGMPPKEDGMNQKEQTPSIFRFELLPKFE